MDNSPYSYQNVPEVEDRDDSSSHIQVAALSEKQWHHVSFESNEGTRKSQAWKKMWQRHSWLVTPLLIAFNIALSLVLLGQISKQHDAPRQIGSEILTNNNPQFDSKVVKWEANPLFVPNNTVDFFEQETVDMWKSLLPASAHRGESENFSTTSMTHQLHCLFMMGRVYAGVTNNRTEELPEDYHAHFLHCIDYVRQGIMCSGDVALEPHSPSDADDLGAKDGGWQGLHVCKDYTQVLGYLDGQIREGIRTVLPIDD